MKADLFKVLNVSIVENKKGSVLENSSLNLFRSTKVNQD